MRILFVAHHRVAHGGGVIGATMQLASEFRALGHTVDLFAHEQAFGAVDPSLAWLRFPSRVAAHLDRVAGSYDVIDATTGDLARWAPRGMAKPPVLVTRAHGLEHVADEALRAHGEPRGLLRAMRYRVAQGGYRLRDVERSLLRARGVIMLNERDVAYTRDRIGVPASRIACIPNGLPQQLLGLPAPRFSETKPLHIAFIGSWIPRKGIAELVATCDALAARKAAFRISLLGTGVSEAQVLAAFRPETRRHCTVEPGFDASSLRERLSDAHVLLHLSWSEGFSLALAEGMACGVAPIATPSGAAWDLVRDGESGVRVNAGVVDCSDQILALIDDRDRLQRLRVGAQTAVQHLAWPRIARDTLDAYERFGSAA